MTIAPNTEITVGQLWSVADHWLYQVEGVIGNADACYPILLREVARSASAQREIDAMLETMARGETRETNAARAARMNAPAVMHQERAWFELRRDVVQWHGTVEAWKEARDV